MAQDTQTGRRAWMVSLAKGKKEVKRVEMEKAEMKKVLSS